jgi:bifunctional non-homologous end joining protein LigD
MVASPSSVAVPPRRLAIPNFRPFQLATLATKVPKADGWLFEMKFDGYRCQAAISGKAVRLYTRRGNDWTDKFARVLPPLQKLTRGTALIDGEICALDAEGRPDFSLLKVAIGAGGPLVFFAFDLLEVGSKDLAPLPQIKRKERLEKLIGEQPGTSALQYSQHIEGHGEEVLKAMCESGREGVVAKFADAPYRGERTMAWIKVKCTKRQEFVVVGWRVPDAGGEGIASLLLATYEGGKLVYRGRVGTGFTNKMLIDLRRRLEPLRVETSPVAKVPRDIVKKARWVQPVTVAEVDYAEVTPDGSLRHPSFKGIREDKDPTEVTLEKPGGDDAT